MTIVIPEPAVRERIHTIRDVLADFDAAKVDEALAFLQASLCELVDAQNADRIGAVHLDYASCDPIDGWRPSVVRFLHYNDKFIESVRE